MVLKFIFSQNKDLQNMYGYFQNISLQTRQIITFLFLNGMDGWFSSAFIDKNLPVVVAKQTHSNGKKAKMKS